MSKKYDFFTEEPEEETEVKEEKPKTTVKTKPKTVTKTVTKTVMIVPELSDMINFCKENIGDDECLKFLEHAVRRKEHKALFGRDRGGGGWSGAIMATLTIMRKMNKNS